MKLSFKDLKQQRFVIEAEPNETIGELKTKIATEKGWEASTQKLIYSGKILQDDNTIESYKIEEKGFIVCMTSKPKTAPAKSAEPATPAKPISTPAAPAAPAQAPSSAPTQVPSTPSPAPAAAAEEVAATPVNFNDPSALAIGEQQAAVIANMESMGFPRQEIDRAMRAAFFNPDRAVEYLLNGIPENLQQEERAPAAATAAAAAAAPTTANTNTSQQPPRSGAAGTQAEEPVNLFEEAAAARRRGTGDRDAADLAGHLGGGQGQGQGERQAGSVNLNFLRDNPQFQQLRTLVQQQPAMLEPILHQLAAGNPEVARAISENPDHFFQLLAEDGDGDVELPPGAQQIQVTEEERDAIDRLCRLGFDRDSVIQAYFACDKNEELAANFLFDQPDDEEHGA